MDMSRPVVVWIDRYAQSVKTENCRHYLDSITIPKRLGFTSSALPTSSTFATSFVERQNSSVRMTNRRYMHLTNGFSKKIENHAASVALDCFAYNFSKI